MAKGKPSKYDKKIRLDVPDVTTFDELLKKVSEHQPEDKPKAKQRKKRTP